MIRSSLLEDLGFIQVEDEYVLDSLGMTLASFDTPLGVQWEVVVDLSKTAYLPVYIHTVKYIETIEELKKIISAIKVIK